MQVRQLFDLQQLRRNGASQVVALQAQLGEAREVSKQPAQAAPQVVSREVQLRHSLWLTADRDASPTRDWDAKIPVERSLPSGEAVPRRQQLFAIGEQGFLVCRHVRDYWHRHGEVTVAVPTVAAVAVVERQEDHSARGRIQARTGVDELRRPPALRNRQRDPRQGEVTVAVLPVRPEPTASFVTVVESEPERTQRAPVPTRRTGADPDVLRIVHVLPDAHVDDHHIRTIMVPGMDDSTAEAGEGGKREERASQCRS